MLIFIFHMPVVLLTLCPCMELSSANSVFLLLFSFRFVALYFLPINVTTDWSCNLFCPVWYLLERKKKERSKPPSHSWMLQQSEHHGGWMLSTFPQLCFKAFWWDLLAPAGERAHCKQRALFVPIRCFRKVKMPVYWQMRTQRPLMFVEFEVIWNTLVCIFCSIRCQQVPGSVSPRASKLFQSCKLSSTQPLGHGVEALIVRSAVARRCPSDKKKRKKKKSTRRPIGSRACRRRWTSATATAATTPGLQAGLIRCCLLKNVFENKVDAFQEVLEGIIQAFESLFFFF